MAKYKLSTGLSTVKEQPEFDTDQKAWDYLRVVLPGRYATLYREVIVDVINNNEYEYVPSWNSKYGPAPIGSGVDSAVLKVIGVPSKDAVWIPVLEGITDHPYNVK